MYYSELILYGLLVIAVLAALREPFWGVVCYTFFSFFRPQEYYHWALGDSRLSYWIALVTIYSYFLHKGRKGYAIPKTKENLLMLLFGIFILLSYYFSLIPERSWPFSLLFGKIIIFYFLISAVVDSEKRFRIMLWILVLTFSYYAIWTNKRFIFEGIKMVEGPGAWDSLYRDRNTFSLLFVTALPICFFMRYIVKHKFLQISLWGIIPVLMHAIIATFSRGGYLGMLAVGAFSITKMKNKWIALLLILVAIPMLMRMQGVEHRERIHTILVTGEEQEYSSKRRIESWRAASQMIKDYPLTGIGLNNFQIFEKNYRAEPGGGRVTHNTFLQIGAEIGIPAMLLFIWIALNSFFTLWRFRFKAARDNLSPNLYWYSLMLEGSLWGFIICSLFLSLHLFEPAYFLFAMVACLKVLVEKGVFNQEGAS